MESDVRLLMDLCGQELDYRGYSEKRKENFHAAWEGLSSWMKQQDLTDFNETLGVQYCNEVFGSHILSGIQKKDQVSLRAIRLLISFQKDGDFEFRTPSVERKFIGESGALMKAYLDYLSETVNLTENTISNKRRYLLAFNVYLESSSLNIDDTNFELLAGFYENQSYSLPSKHNCNSTLKLFLRYLFDNGLSRRDHSIFILPDAYKGHREIPTTYQEDEIQRTLETIERASAIGKRDYVILLLAAQYGWRSSDIVSFRFDQIDWDSNSILVNQQKTGCQNVYPLLSSVGNAIIDYLKHGRPDTETPEILVSMNNVSKGRKLSTPTVHSIVSKYLRKAHIKDWKEKKHGPHSLRHSLATNMLKRSVSLPIISTVLGHQSTETTRIYLSLDFGQLKQCALPIPALKTRQYGGGGQ
jgi:integrase/recombinase XerD